MESSSGACIAGSCPTVRIGRNAGPSESCVTGGFLMITRETIMETHQQRVIAERNELSQRIEKLSIFVNSDDFEAVDVDEKDRLLRQWGAMMKYRSILNERIAFF